MNHKYLVESIRSALKALEALPSEDVDQVIPALSKLDSDMWDIVDIANPEKEYEIRLSCTFMARNPGLAIEHFINWMKDSPYDYVYETRKLGDEGWELHEGSGALEP
jgi:hypothetical protein